MGILQPVGFESFNRLGPLESKKNVDHQQHGEESIDSRWQTHQAGLTTIHRSVSFAHGRMVWNKTIIISECRRYDQFIDTHYVYCNRMAFCEKSLKSPKGLKTSQSA